MTCYVASSIIQCLPESLQFWEVLIVKNQDIQKVLAFQGAFDKLFNIITSEGGIESRVNAQSALTCVDTLLRFNSANQVRSLCDCLAAFEQLHRPSSAKRLTHLCFYPYCSSHQTCPLRNLHLKISHCSFGMPSNTPTRLWWWV